jgi:AcrR family transcriptional regulator
MRSYHHGNLRRALLDAAMELFAKRGRFDFTLRELARAAGVTHNAPYRHFADRWALLDALAAEGFQMLREWEARTGMPRKDDPRARVLRLGEAYVQFALAHPNHFRLMFLRPLEDASAELVRVQQETFAVLEDAIEVARTSGVLRDSLSTKEAVLAAWALVHGLASLAVSGQVPSQPQAMRKQLASLGAIFADGAFASSSARPPRRT